MAHQQEQTFRICLVIKPDIVQKTLYSFLTDLGYDVISVAPDNLWKYPEDHTDTIHFAIISQSIDTSLLKKFHRQHAETMIVLLHGNVTDMSTENALSYGVYAFLHTPIHLNELEVLLIRLTQYRMAHDT